MYMVVGLYLVAPLAFVPSVTRQFPCSSIGCRRTRSVVSAGDTALDAVQLARLQEDAKKLDSDAAALLEELNGDAEKARTSYMGYTLAYVKEEMPELYDRIRTDPTHPDAHRALVEITWDAIAAFLPVTHSPKLTEAAQKKLTAVARAGCDGTSDSPMSTLDVSRDAQHTPKKHSNPLFAHTHAPYTIHTYTYT